MSVNKVILMGNVCADPRIKRFDNNGAVGQFSLATNKRAYKTRDGRDIPEQTEFHNIVVNRSGLVDVTEKYVKKGDKLYIEGELRTRKFDVNGITHYTTEIYVENMEMLTPKSTSAPAPTPEPEPYGF